MSASVFASEMRQEITKIAAHHGNCSKQNPCLIDIHKRDNGYSILVRRSASISDYGVLTSTTSGMWVIFDKEGKFIRAIPTP
jgi:hypothetical protein